MSVSSTNPVSTTSTLPREFLWCGASLADPDPGLSSIAVRDLYAGQFPELTNAAIKEAVVRDGRTVIEFTKKVGTKG